MKTLSHFAGEGDLWMFAGEILDVAACPTSPAIPNDIPSPTQSVGEGLKEGAFRLKITYT